jgi:hypothetical protein
VEFGMAADSEETLALEFKALFKRIRDLGYREGEQAAFNRIISIAQSSLNEAKTPPGGPAAASSATPTADSAAPAKAPEGPTPAQRRDPLRPFG